MHRKCPLLARSGHGATVGTCLKFRVLNCPEGDMKRRGKASGSLRKATLPKARKTSMARVSTSHVREELDHALRERDEALEQVSATSEILKIISKSPGELEPVFDAMLENATRICAAKFATLYLRDGVTWRAVATTRDAPPEYVEVRKRNLLQLSPGGPLDQVVNTKQVFHIADMKELPPYRERHPTIVAAVELGRFRTCLIVPMLRDDELVGAVSILRQEVRPFTDKQINLLENFAAQGVIAIDNTRLLNELRQRTDDLSESLEQQTAASEVLKVISSSPGELEPVFQAMLGNATRICQAQFGALFRYENGAFHPAAYAGVPQALAEFWQQRASFLPPVGSPLDRLLKTSGVIFTADAAAEPVPGAPARLGGARSLVAVPMFKDDALVGTIVIYRQEVQPFTEKQIALLSNFASQAVIAIENARLLNELRQRTDDLSESLEQQTATSEVLKVISSSPGELDRVFKEMLKKATQICGASFGTLLLFEDNAFRRVAAHNAPHEYVQFADREPILRLDRARSLESLIKTKEPVQIADMAEAEPDSPLTKLGGARTYFAVPMLKENELIGAISIYRQEVRQFTDKQIELVQNFAAQAVIAIENARLLDDLNKLNQ